MADFAIRRLTALPGSPAANTLYIINPPGEDTYAEVYITGNSGGAIRRVLNPSDVQTLINASLAAMSLLHIVADITARDALSLGGNGNAFVLVTDATDDVTVASGAALYAFNDTGDTFSKLTEYESLDLVVDWSDVQNKPSSSVSSIDDAVTKRHEHTNMTQLNKVGESGGVFTYDGLRPTVEWTETGW